MTVSPTLYSSDRQDWETPQALFDLLDAEFHFTLDPCATPENAKCARYFTKEDDGMLHIWSGTVYVNPPYGCDIGRWVAKSYLSAKRTDATVVLLIPARTDTKYWHNYIMHAAELRFIKGRLKFVGAQGCAPFPSVVAVFRPGEDGPPTCVGMERE